MNRFHIICCGWFPQDNPYYAYECINACVRSVTAQNYERWNMVIATDCIPQITELNIFSDSRISCISNNSIRLGAAHNRYKAATELISGRSDDVLVFLDLDDALACEDALSIVARQYNSDESCWLTYGSYRTKSGAPARFNGPIDKNQKIRLQPWRTSHLKTCSLGLFRHLKPIDLQNRKREWLTTATDVAMVYALIDMAGMDRIRYVPEIIYEYNDTNPNSVHRVAAMEQKAVEQYLRSLAPKKRLVEL